MESSDYNVVTFLIDMVDTKGVKEFMRMLTDFLQEYFCRRDIDIPSEPDNLDVFGTRQSLAFLKPTTMEKKMAEIMGNVKPEFTCNSILVSLISLCNIVWVSLMKGVAVFSMPGQDERKFIKAVLRAHLMMMSDESGPKFSRGSSGVSSKWASRGYVVTISLLWLYGREASAYEESVKKVELNNSLESKRLEFEFEQSKEKFYKAHSEKECTCCHCLSWGAQQEERRAVFEKLFSMEKAVASQKLEAQKPEKLGVLNWALSILSVWFFVEQFGSTPMAASKR